MIRCILAILALGIAAPVSAQQIQSLADQIVRSGSPGSVVMHVTENGEDVAVAGLRAAGEDVAIDRNDRWHLGSNTKAMTAILAARLVEQGELNWDSRLGDVLDDAFGEIDPQLADATLEELLNHTSGLRANVGGLVMISLSGPDSDRDPRADRFVYLDAVLDNAAGPRGTFLYSNAGYVAAAAMLEEATGLSWEALIRRELFDELGLESAGFGPPDVGANPQGHRESWGRLVAVGAGRGADNPVAMNPAGRVHMSMHDYADFLRLVMRGVRGEDNEYLSDDSWNRLVTPPPGGSYALGWGVQPGGALSHAGSNTMWFLQAIIWPEAGEAAVAAVNEGRTSRVGPATGQALMALSPN